MVTKHRTRFTVSGTLAVSLCGVTHARPAEADPAMGSSVPPATETKEAPARPAPLPLLLPAKTNWERHVEVGPDLVLVSRPASTDAEGHATPLRYAPSIGFGLHARWNIFRHLGFAAYFLDADHSLELSRGALNMAAEATRTNVHSFSFGARVSPTLPLSDRARLWVTSGIGWGRLELGELDVHQIGRSVYSVRSRAQSFAEVPVGLGASYELVKKWLTLHIESVGSYPFGQQGDALDRIQVIDAEGKRRQIGGIPTIDASFVQTVGMSLVL